MSAATISVTETMLFTALRAFLLTMVPDSSVIQGYQNRVAMPNGATVEMTTLWRKPLSTTNAPSSGWGAGSANPGTASYERSTEWCCQLDFFDDGAADAAAIVNELVRSDYALETFNAQSPAVLQPLYATDSRQLPFINDSEQYEPRHFFEFHAQYNPVIVMPEDFMTVVTVTPVSVDVRFPPSEI